MAKPTTAVPCLQSLAGVPVPPKPTRQAKDDCTKKGKRHIDSDTRFGRAIPNFEFRILASSHVL